MLHDDLPLFAWTPPRKIILFPLTNRVGKVRHTAGLLSQKHGEDAVLYWRQVISANRKHLTRVGLTDDEIDAELRAFHDAVQGELVRMAYAGRGSSHDPRGAA
jgi:hypothetical protein